MNKKPDLTMQRDLPPDPPHKGEEKREFARSLRNNATPAERILWQQLKLLKAEGRHFRRQVPLAGYIADFACHYPKLVVELDGGQHGDAVPYDEAHTRQMNAHGFPVLRFWNTDVFQTLEGVVDRIRHAVRLPTTFTYTYLNQSQTPTPALPTRGRVEEMKTHG